MQHACKTILSLAALIAMTSSLLLFGCSEDIEQAMIRDVRHRSFRFAHGAVFHPALANMPTTLSFTDNPPNFTLSSTGGTATGASSFGPCILTVTSSTYALDAGPQVNDMIRLPLCDFDTSNNTLIVGNGTTTAISAPAVPL